MAERTLEGGPTEGQAAVRRLVALGAALVALLLIGGAAVLIVSSRALDDMSVRKDRTLVQSTMDHRLRSVATDLTTSTVWDQAYRELKPGGDLGWADREIGSYFANNRGHAWTIAVDGGGRPFYAWVGARRADPDRQGRRLAGAAAVVRRVRAVEAARSAPSRQIPDAAPARSETAAGIVELDGVYYAVAASTVTPESADEPRRPGPAVLVISAERLNGRMTNILARLGIEGARIVPFISPLPSSAVLRDIDGRPIGSLVWRPTHPGLQVLSGAAPGMIFGGLAALAVAAALALEIVRVSRSLDRHQRGHDTALAELAEARDRAEAANLSKSRFLANMSHEIRTPLNGVLGMAQVLGRSQLSAEDRKKVEVIRTSGETLLGLLNDLLDLSKIEAGRMDIEVADFDLEQAVTEATHSFAALAAQKGVRFMVDVAHDVDGVWRGDGGRLRQVLANLASNAVKFTAEGEIRTCVRRTATGIACTVSDTGAGIARDRLPQLFERFSQVDPTATRKFGGSGLGLAITRELVELMGGTVAATSVEGRGSAFTFELPLEWVGPRPDPVAAAQEAGALPRVRILAAEDNKTNQVLLSAMLAPLGVELRIVEDGARAVEAFSREAYDLVLMDVQMPVMNGVDATRAIRAIEAEGGLAPTPILALSANVMRHQTEEYLAAGMNGFVAKPIEMAVLVGAIEDALAGGDAAREAAA